MADLHEYSDAFTNDIAVREGDCRGFFFSFDQRTAFDIYLLWLQESKIQHYTLTFERFIQKLQRKIPELAMHAR